MMRVKGFPSECFRALRIGPIRKALPECQDALARSSDLVRHPGALGHSVQPLPVDLDGVAAAGCVCCLRFERRGGWGK